MKIYLNLLLRVSESKEYPGGDAKKTNLITAVLLISNNHTSIITLW